MNPFLLDVILMDMRRDLVREAERQRLIALYNGAHPGRRARILLALGDFLIRLGEKIKRRSTKPLDMDDDLCRE